jgi:hypothetical protein
MATVQRNFHFALLCLSIAIDYLLYRQSAWLCLSRILQSAVCSTDNPLGSACRYGNRLSALPTIRSALPVDIALVDYPLYRQSPVALHGDTTTNYPLCSVWRHYNRLHHLLSSKNLLCEQLK